MLLSLSLVLPVQAIITEPDFDDHAKLHPTRAPMLEQVGQLGKRQSGSAVYLGKRWILTANHAFEGRSGDVVYFSGREYRLLTATAVRLKNTAASGGPGKTDLLMVQLAADPHLPALEIDEHSPFIAEKVVMVGCGLTESTPELDRRLTKIQNSGARIEVEPISGGRTEGVAGPHWGENEIAERGVHVGIPDHPGMTRAFATIKQRGHKERATQGATGDSGGGVFVKRGDKWKLSGIMLSVLVREDIDASATFSADLSVYREQIVSTIPEPSVAGLLFIAGLIACGRRSR